MDLSFRIGGFDLIFGTAGSVFMSRRETPRIFDFVY